LRLGQGVTITQSRLLSKNLVLIFCKSSPTLKLWSGSSRARGSEGSSSSSVKFFSLGIANLELFLRFLESGSVFSRVRSGFSSVTDARLGSFFLGVRFGPTFGPTFGEAFGDCLRLPERWDFPDLTRPGASLRDNFAIGIWIGFFIPGDSSQSSIVSDGGFLSGAPSRSSADGPSRFCPELGFFRTFTWIIGVTDLSVLGDAYREVVSSLLLFSSFSKRTAASSAAFFLAAASSAAFFLAAASSAAFFLAAASSAAFFFAEASSSSAFFFAAYSSNAFFLMAAYSSAASFLPAYSSAASFLAVYSSADFFPSAAFLLISSACFSLFPTNLFCFRPFLAEFTEGGSEPAFFLPVSSCFSPEGLILNFMDKNLRNDDSGRWAFLENTDTKSPVLRSIYQSHSDRQPPCIHLRWRWIPTKLLLSIVNFPIGKVNISSRIPHYVDVQDNFL
jgi:hypothetical protein